MKVKRFSVQCSVSVSEDDVWNYLEENVENIDELRKNGYEPTDEDWRDTVEAMFNNDDFTYYDFVEEK